MKMNVDSSDKISPPEKESRQIQRIAAYGFLQNLAIVLMKAVLAFATGSLVITASAIDSATDSISSLVLYLGLKLSEQKTSAFPMGLYKIENLLSVVIAFFIFYAGFEIAHHTFFSEVTPPRHLPDGDPPHPVRSHRDPSLWPICNCRGEADRIPNSDCRRPPPADGRPVNSGGADFHHHELLQI